MRIEWMEKYMADAEKMIIDGDVTEGLQLLDKLLYEEPGYASLHNHIGWAYMYYTNDNVKAEQHFRLANKFDPSFGASWMHLTALYVRMQRYDDAIAVGLKGALVPDSNKVTILEHIAKAYELKKDYGKAIRFYKDALTSTAGHEGNVMSEGIRRCRKKRLALMFAF